MTALQKFLTLLAMTVLAILIVPVPDKIFASLFLALAAGRYFVLWQDGY